jgi:hypothetical protein
MFDAEHGGGSGCVNSDEPNTERTARRQYTLKGIENETIELMRVAAQKEGMKIGSWVSLRMKEAAERALSDERVEVNSRSAGATAQALESGELVHQLRLLIQVYRETAEERLLKIEQELHEITSGQRTIMTSLLSQNSSR